MDAKVALVVLCVLSLYSVLLSTVEAVNYDLFVKLDMDDLRGVEVLKSNRSPAVDKSGEWKQRSGGQRRDSINAVDASHKSTDNNTVGSYNVDNATYINGSLSNVTEYNNTGVSDHSNVHNFTQKLTFSNILNSSVTAALGKIKKYKSIKKIVQIGPYDVTIELIDLQSLLPANRSSLLKSAKKNRN